jgi:hypothetical protein
MGFEPAFPESEQPSTHALDRAEAGIRFILLLDSKIPCTCPEKLFVTKFKFGYLRSNINIVQMSETERLEVYNADCTIRCSKRRQQSWCRDMHILNLPEKKIQHVMYK